MYFVIFMRPEYGIFMFLLETSLLAIDLVKSSN